jgi:hypothetical protein
MNKMDQPHQNKIGAKLRHQVLNAVKIATTLCAQHIKMKSNCMHLAS